jgi:small subunit ribosomal protein S21e
LEKLGFSCLSVVSVIEFDFFFFSFSSATNRLITAKDHASVQINIGHLDESGLYNGQFSTFALCGFTRAQVLIFYVL